MTTTRKDVPDPATGSAQQASRVFQAQTPDDLLGFIPVALGFDPTESLVMVRIGAGGPHARLDLPESRQEEDHACRALLHACVLHRVDRVALAVYAGRPERWSRWVALLAERLGRAGVEVVEVMAVNPWHWFRLLEPTAGDRWRVPRGPVTERHPYDAIAHPFRTTAVVEGSRVLGSRQELATLLAPDRDQVAATRAAMREMKTPVAPAGSAISVTEQEWMQQVLAEHAEARTVPGPEVRARILRNLAAGELRDRAWGPVRCPQAPAHVDLWCGLVRATPKELRPGPLSVLGYLAWLSGNGALAWIAVDQAQERGPHPLAQMVSWLLEQAVAPVAFGGPGTEPHSPGRDS